MSLSLQCECGQVQGTVLTGHGYARATCYCADCQAYARWLDQPGLTDAHGGTDLVAMNPSAVRFTAGEESIACMSLSEKGLLRWYARCCRSPLANTPRDPNLAYVGIFADRLSPPRMVDAAFGPPGETVLNAGSAVGRVGTTPVTFLAGGLHIVGGILAAKLHGQAPTLFFDEHGHPLRDPQVLTPARRARLQPTPDS